ncbi:MAG: hypothetical protein IJM97_06210 [Clostridia bacterium]|nr:hypothetical protein [Clostridia bacterium]MBQ6708523.1 hypothetical protein [Clostridia bacterium]
MITVKPVEKENTVAFIAEEEGSDAGFCEIALDNYEVEVLSAEYDKDKPYALELLLRAALNFAANRNAYIAKTKLDIFTDFPFEKKGDFYEGTIPELLKGSCKS